MAGGTKQLHKVAARAVSRRASFSRPRALFEREPFGRWHAVRDPSVPFKIDLFLSPPPIFFPRRFPGLFPHRHRAVGSPEAECILTQLAEVATAGSADASSREQGLADGAGPRHVHGPEHAGVPQQRRPGGLRHDRQQESAAAPTGPSTAFSRALRGGGVAGRC